MIELKNRWELARRDTVQFRVRKLRVSCYDMPKSSDLTS